MTDDTNTPTAPIEGSPPPAADDDPIAQALAVLDQAAGAVHRLAWSGLDSRGDRERARTAFLSAIGQISAPARPPCRCAGVVAHRGVR